MNANVQIITTANTFNVWLTQTNNLANLINGLLNGLFYGDNGSLTLANGQIQLLGGTYNTPLSVTGNATITQQLSTGSINDTGDLTVGGTVVSFTNPNGVVQVANTTQSANLIASSLLQSVNTNISGTVILTGATLSNTFGNVIVFFNELPVINVNSNFYITNTGNVQINGTLYLENSNASLNVSGNANIAHQLTIGGNLVVDGTSTLTGLNLGTNELEAYNIILDLTSTYSLVNGNAVINNLTVKGTQTIEGTTVLSSNAFQLRSNSVGDGDGAFQVWRGTTVNANATILFNNSAGVIQFTANDSQPYNTILTTSNLVDNFVNTSVTNAATANAVNAAYAAAIANATGIVANNGVFIDQRKGINFITESGIVMNVSSNTTNTSLTDISIGAEVNDQYSNTGTITGNTNVNCLLGSFFDFTLANNANIGLQNCVNSGNVTTIQILIRQSANGGNTVNFTNTIYWSDNTVPILSTTANTGDVLQFTTFNGGVIWLGAQVYANMQGMNVVTSYA